MDFPGYGNLTAGDVVMRGRFEGLINYLEHIFEGGYS